MKTNKSFTKRLKVTKKSGILARKPGQNHFNAKAPREKQLAKKRYTEIDFTNKAKARFLPATGANSNT